MQLVIVGFHRSGTSLLAQLLHRAGLFLGDDLLGVKPSNPYGHYEDLEVLDFHREVMEAHGVGWQVDSPQLFTLSGKQWTYMQDFVARRNAKHRIWGFKDPRVCFFLGAWQHVMPDARFVIVYRDPVDCARSLEARQASDYMFEYGFDLSGAEQKLPFFRQPDHTLRMWDAHNRAVAAFARHHPDDCIVLPMSALDNGYPVVAAINTRFGCDLDLVPTEAVFDPAATSQRNTAQWVHDGHLLDRVNRTWTELTRLSELTEAR